MLPGMLALERAVRESSGKTHELGLPSRPTEKSGEGTADGDNKTGRGLGRQRVPSMGCEDVCESLEKGVATGGAGGEPTDPKVWGLGPATCASTCAPGDADACWSVRSSKLEHLEMGLPRGLAVSGEFS